MQALGEGERSSDGPAPAEAGRARTCSSPVGSSSRGPPCHSPPVPTPAPSPPNWAHQCTLPPGVVGGDQEKGTEPLYSTGHNKVLATSASNPRPQRKKPTKTGVGGVPTSGSKAPGSHREKTWGRREAPTPLGRGRWPPPHPAPGAPLTRTAARESAGKLGLPYPFPRLGDLALLRSRGREVGKRLGEEGAPRGSFATQPKRPDRGCPPSGDRKSVV